MTTQIRAKRILSRLASYRPVESLGNDFEALAEQLLPQGATPIGVYENAQGEGREKLFISDLGVLVEGNSGKFFVEFKSVERVDVVAGNMLLEADVDGKSDADGLLISMLDTSRKVIPVRNGHGRYRDVFEFARFMSRAVEDARKTPLPAV